MQKAYKLNKDFVLTCVKDERKKIKAILIRIKRKLRIFVEFSFVYQLNRYLNHNAIEKKERSM